MTQSTILNQLPKKEKEKENKNWSYFSFLVCIPYCIPGKHSIIKLHLHLLKKVFILRWGVTEGSGHACMDIILIVLIAVGKFIYSGWHHYLGGNLESIC